MKYAVKGFLKIRRIKRQRMLYSVNQVNYMLQREVEELYLAERVVSLIA